MFSKKTGGFFFGDEQNDQHGSHEDGPPLEASLIGTDLRIHGDLTSLGEIHVKGLIEGDVAAARIIIDTDAAIKGHVMAEEVIVKGKVDGELRSMNVQLCAGCHVSGDIIHEALTVENGAYFEGNIKHSEDPLSQKSSKKQLPAKTQSSAKSASGKAKAENTARRLRATSQRRAVDNQVVIKGSDVLVRRDAAE